MPVQTNNNKTLAQVLLDSKAIAPEQFEKIKIESLNTGKTQEEIIKTHNFASEEQLIKAKAQVYNIPFVDLKETSISPEALNLLPESVAKRYNCFPYGIKKEENLLLLAMANPLDLNAIEFIEQKTKKRLAVAFAVPEDIQETINQYYAQSLSAEVTEALKSTGTVDNGGVRVVNAQQVGKIIREAPLAKIVTTLLDFAIKARASDIHIEPQEEKTRVRYRIDGILHEKLVLPKNIHDGVISRIKILAGMKIDEKRIPQDGRFTFQQKEAEVDLRVSSLPTVHGEKIVMRLLKKSGNVPSMSELGLRGRALKDLQKSIILPHGIVLVTGPTGSGKTTTLYSALSKINTSRVNIMTLEDPVEYEIVGVSQVQVNPKAGLTFASGLRSFLRQDPDIIMVGEIRDVETAELAVQAALTGHLVFSTLHTNSAAGALPRLLDMEAEPYLLSSSIICVVGQRVVRRVCQQCKESYKPAAEMVDSIKKVLGPLYNVKGELSLYKGKGCEKCNDTGYVGRIGIYEVLPVTEKISRLILERSPSLKIEKQAREEGMVTMTQDGYLKAVEGITTIEEVLRVSEV
jgi:type IV pilus assembly protein PilB